MENRENTEAGIMKESIAMLKMVGLSWEDLKNKTVLDVGAGEAKLAQAAKIIDSSVNIFSVDTEKQKSWDKLPDDIKKQTFEAMAKELPFPDNSFDLIINLNSIEATSIIDEERVLKNGGEIRISPIGKETLDLWNVGYYLQVYKKWPIEKIQQKISDFERSINENDGWRPNEYADLEESATKALTKDQKIDVIESLITKYEEVTGLKPLNYKITDSNHLQPKGYIIYRKIPL